MQAEARLSALGRSPKTSDSAYDPWCRQRRGDVARFFAWSAEELTDAPAALQALPPGATLQTVLDAFCQVQFQKLCEKLDDDFCGVEAIARHGPGRRDQPKKQWRCYSKKSIGPEAGGDVSCADSCGAVVPCEGTVDRDSTVHFTAHHLIEQVINRFARETCSGVQKKLDEFCSRFGPRVVARFLPAPTDIVDRWRCVSSVGHQSCWAFYSKYGSVLRTLFA